MQQQTRNFLTTSAFASINGANVLLLLYNVKPAVGNKRARKAHIAVRLLKIFQNGDYRAGNGYCRSV